MVVEVAGIWVVSTYVSLNSSRAEYQDMLAELEDIVRFRDHKRTIIAGDFNARAAAWDPRGINNRGQLVEGWATGLGLQLLNEGTKPTLTNTRGASTIDLTWVTPDLGRRIQEWNVLDLETLSDHKYIMFRVRSTKRTPIEDAKTEKYPKKYPKWNFTKLDLEKFCIALDWSRCDCPTGEETAEFQMEWVSRKVKEACDLAAPKTGRRREKRQAYW